MNLYVWNFVSNLTDNYHNGGGVGVIAETVDDARAAITAHVANPADRWSRPITTPGEWVGTEPDEIIAVHMEDDPRVVFIHPDAGCC